MNVLSKITPAFYENLASKKWKDRKEQLEKLVEWCDNPRLEPGDYGELTKNLKKVCYPLFVNQKFVLICKFRLLKKMQTYFVSRWLHARLACLEAV